MLVVMMLTETNESPGKCATSCAGMLFVLYRSQS